MSVSSIQQIRTGFSRAVISARSDYPFLARAVSQTRDVPIDIQHPPAGGDSSRRGQMLCTSFAGAPRSAPLERDHAAAPSQEGFSALTAWRHLRRQLLQARGA
jgi:hypothetical protein